MHTDTVRECACGYVMTPINGYHMCSNCDVVQPQERETDAKGNPKPRRITTADRRFHLVWEARKRQIYGTA